MQKSWKWKLAIKEVVESKRKPDGSKITQGDIATAIDTTQQTISDLYKLHHKRLDANSVARIAAYLEVNWDDLVIGLVEVEE